MLAVACLMNANINPEKVLNHREHSVYRKNDLPCHCEERSDAAIQRFYPTNL